MTSNQFNFCVQNAMDFTDPDAYVSELALSDIWGDAPDAPIPQERLDDLQKIYAAVNRNVRDIAAAAGISHRKLAERFCVPYRTMESWCSGDRQCALYVRLMMQECLGLYGTQHA